MKTLIKTQYDAITELTGSDAFYTGNYEKLAKMVVKTSSQIIEVERVGVWFFDDDGNTLKSVSLIGNGKFLKNLAIKTSDFPNYTAALKKKRSIVADNALTNKDTKELGPSYLDKIGISSMLDSGIRKGKEIIGVLCLEHVGQMRKWTMEEINFAGILSDLLGQAYTLKEARETEAELNEKRVELEEANIALKNVLARFEEEKRLQKENIAINIEKNILPLVHQIKKECNANSELVRQLETSIENLTSKFYKKLAQFNMNLSPSEIKICQMIKSGYQGKEIAQMLNLSFSTVETHKKNIRKKLKLTGRTINLKVFLNDLEV